MRPTTQASRNPRPISTPGPRWVSLNGPSVCRQSYRDLTFVTCAALRHNEANLSSPPQRAPVAQPPSSLMSADGSNHLRTPAYILSAVALILFFYVVAPCIKIRSDRLRSDRSGSDKSGWSFGKKPRMWDVWIASWYPPRLNKDEEGSGWAEFLVSCIRSHPTHFVLLVRPGRSCFPEYPAIICRQGVRRTCDRFLASNECQ